ncbi:MAG: helix-turn-helix domain-containing protein [Candidatus Magasanikbacteria bacterium]|nr:helix-turn-helix domain-containing protein [Candidatus Magasanikbacteria bacterium]
MVSFRGKLLSQEERLGDVLRAYRMRRGLSVKDIASRLGLAAHFIDWVESGKYHKLPGEVYAKNFVKRYAQLVGINVSAALAQYAKERLLPCIADDAKKNFIKRLSAWWHPGIATRVAGVLILAAVVGYVGLQARNIFSPPPLVIENPLDGLVSSIASVQLMGHSLPETKIQVNGREMITDTKGAFVETLDLTPGMNTFTIVAIKKHGAKTIIVRNILLEQKVSVAPSSGAEVH